MSPEPTSPGMCRACAGTLACALPRVLDPVSREHFAIFTCAGCGLGHTWPRPSDLSRYYGATYYGGRHGVTDRLCVARRLRWLEQHAPSSKSVRLLDFGCGEGTFLSAARARGFRTFGIEPGAAAAAARARGHEVCASLDDPGVPGPFDAVTCFHSLEHVPDPAATLKALHARMTPGARLIVAVPDLGGLQAAWFGRHWLHLDVPRHLFHFTSRALAILLERAGFAVARTYHQELEYDLIGVTQSALDALLPEPRLLLSQLTGRRVGRPLPVLASFAFAALTGPLAAAVTLAGTALGRGGTLVMIAERR